MKFKLEKKKKKSSQSHKWDATKIHQKKKINKREEIIRGKEREKRGKKSSLKLSHILVYSTEMYHQLNTFLKKNLLF